MNALTHVVAGGSGSTLSPKAEAVLRYLMDHPNRTHTGDEIAKAIGSTIGGRSITTYVAMARKALGPILRDNIVVEHGEGAYGWYGEPVDLTPAVSSSSRAKSNDPISRYAVVTVPEVAKRLGISEATVKYSERRALAKLRAKPELKQAWLELLSCHQRFTYDPFQEVWLFSVSSSHQSAV